MDFSNPLFWMLTIIGAILFLMVLVRIVVFFVKPSVSRDHLRLAFPLSLLARLNRKNHVFVGTSAYSKLLAAQILQEWKQQRKKTDQGKILFVQLAQSFSEAAEQQLQEELGPRVKLFQGTFIGQDIPSLAKALELEGLSPWLANPRTSLYLFSDNPQENAQLLSVTTDDPSIKAKVFYFASEPDGFDSLVASTGARVRLLNPHQMSFMHLKMDCPEALPVHFVQKALDAQGEPLGYVEKGLHALVLGFGSTGQEALRFLLEFGSFVGKDHRRAPMSIHIYDPLLPLKKGPFLQSAPALKEDSSLEWHPEAAGSEAFWDAFEKDRDCNYMIVAIDNGPRNIQMGVSLLQAAARQGRDLSQMIILVRVWNQTVKDQEILDLYNASYCPQGVQVLRSFGNTADIWTADVISGRRLKKTALRFNEQQKALGLDEGWEERRQRLSAPGPNRLRNQQELRRRQAMDIARALYIPTLLTFTSSSGEPDASQMAYLSAQEHLHWMQALFVLGYTNGPLDELLKTHPNLVPYPDITSHEGNYMGEPVVKSMLAFREE